jgi:hypothetical protein
MGDEPIFTRTTIFAGGCHGFQAARVLPCIACMAAGVVTAFSRSYSRCKITDAGHPVIGQQPKLCSFTYARFLADARR